jgi:hypothetical protein
MKLSRRHVLGGATAALLVAGENAESMARETFSAAPSGWKNLPLGGGGWVTGLDIANDASKVCKTDAYGAYYWNQASSTWEQVVNSVSMAPVGVTGPIGSFGNGGAGVDAGVWEIRIGPTNSSLVWMIYQIIGKPRHYQLYKSTDKAKTWSLPASPFVFVADDHFYAGGCIANGNSARMTNEKLAIDPNNEEVVYFGLPEGALAQHFESGGAYVSRNGGRTWIKLTDIPNAKLRPGIAGIAIDGTQTISVNGTVCSSRIIIPVGGVGVFESIDGGQTFKKVTKDPAPPTEIQYATQQPNSLIVVASICYGGNSVKSVSNNNLGGDPASLSWRLRGFNKDSGNAQASTFVYYAIAKRPGIYNITVQYNDGAGDHFEGAIHASCSAAKIGLDGHHDILVVDASSKGRWSIGDFITGARLSKGLCIVDDQSTDPSLTGNGGAGTYRLSAKALTPAPTSARSYDAIANVVGAFALSGADQTKPFDDGSKVHPAPWVASGGAYWSLVANFINIETQYPNSKVYQVALAGQGLTPSPDPGYTTVLQDDISRIFLQIMVEATTRAGTQTKPGASANGRDAGAYFIDAIRQANGHSLALDGQPQIAWSKPSLGLQPVAIQTGQLDHSGNYWCIDGPTYRRPGGVWRYLKGRSFERMDGAGHNILSGSQILPFGALIAASMPGIAIADPRPSREGHVIIMGNGGMGHGWNTSTGLEATTAVTWVGSAGRSDFHAKITNSKVAWQDELNRVSALGNMKVDPTDGTYWLCNGSGVVQYRSDLNFDLLRYTVNGTYQTQGIEELLVQDILMPPGGRQLLVGAEDQMILFAQPPRYPETRYNNAYDADANQFDYASSDPAFVCALAAARVGSASQLSCYSKEYGAVGTWREFPTKPQRGGITNGNIACASPGNIVAVTNTGIPQYTIDGGQSWHNSAGAPRDAYIFSPQSTGRVLAADRVKIGTIYLYSKTNGFFRSPDGGQNFAKCAPGIKLEIRPVHIVLPTPGNAGHVWLTMNYPGGFPSNLNHSVDGGDNWTTIQNIANVQLFAMGAAYPEDNYPCLFILGSFNGDFGYWRGRSRNRGGSFTWTKFGNIGDVPSTQSLASPHMMTGDWNVPGRCYLAPFGCGAVMYDP